MNIVILLNVITPFLSFAGMIMIGHKNKYGFLLFLLVECSLAIIGWKTGQYGICVMAGLYLLADIYAYYLWKNGEERLHHERTRL